MYVYVYVSVCMYIECMCVCVCVNGHVEIYAAADNFLQIERVTRLKIFKN